MDRLALNPKFARLFIVSLVLTIAWIAFMKSELGAFSSEEIVAFEFAGTPEKASAIIAEWKQKNWIYYATHSLYLDFIFMFLYGATLALGSLTLPALTGKPTFLPWGMRFYRISLAAGLCDFFENLCLMKVLTDVPQLLFTGAAWGFAFVKFTFVILVLTFFVVCGVQWILNKFAR